MLGLAKAAREMTGEEHLCMAGGGALIRGIDRLLSEKTGLPVIVAEDPLSAVANGTGAVLSDLSWVLQHA